MEEFCGKVSLWYGCGEDVPQTTTNNKENNMNKTDRKTMLNPPLEDYSDVNVLDNSFQWCVDIGLNMKKIGRTDTN